MTEISDITEQESRDALRQFFMLAVAWLPLGFFFWYYLSGMLVFPLGHLTRMILVGALPALFAGLDQNAHFFEIITRIPVDQGLSGGAGEGGLIAFDINPMIYAYGLPVLFGLVMSTPLKFRERALQLLLGYLGLLLVQAWGVSFEALKSLAFGLPGGDQAILQSGIPPTLIALGYQLGYLVLPALAPVVLWIAMNRRFFRVLSRHSGLF